MRKILLWIFLPFIFLTLLALFLIPLMQKDPGYVLIAVGGKIIEMRFWMAVIILVIIGVGIWATKLLVVGSWRATIKTFNWWPAKSQAILWKRQERAMAALWEGDIYEAHRNFVKIAKTKGQDTDTLSLINAANTAADLGKFEESNHFLTSAEALTDDAHAVTLVMSRARYHQKQGQNEAALGIINKALSQFPNHAGLLNMLLSIYRGQKDWPALHAVLARFKKAKILNDEELAALERDIYRGLLAKVNNEHELDLAWKNTPKTNRSDAEIEYFYLQQLLNLGCDTTAEPILRKLLKSHYDDELINLFAHTKSQDPNLQLQYAERWLDHKAKNPALFLALGRIALRCELWGKARDYFEKSLNISPTPEAYAELARLLGNLGDHQNSNALFQKGLLHSTGKALPRTAPKN